MEKYLFEKLAGVQAIIEACKKETERRKQEIRSRLKVKPKKVVAEKDPKPGELDDNKKKITRDVYMFEIMKTRFKDRTTVEVSVKHFRNLVRPLLERRAVYFKHNITNTAIERALDEINNTLNQIINETEYEDSYFTEATLIEITNDSKVRKHKIKNSHKVYNLSTPSDMRKWIELAGVYEDSEFLLILK